MKVDYLVESLKQQQTMFEKISSFRGTQ